MDCYEDTRETTEEIREQAKKVGLVGGLPKTDEKIRAINREIEVQGGVIQQLEVMERMERMLVQITNLMKKQKSTDVANHIRQSARGSTALKSFAFTSESH